MRYVTFSTANDRAPRLGVAHGDRVVDLRAVATSSTTLPASLVELIRSGPAVWRQAAELLNGAWSGLAGTGVPMKDIRWHAPIPRPCKNVFCVGRHRQFFKGKSLDGSCPIGPHVVTADQFGDPHAKEITLRLNGMIKQRGNTADMIFRIDALIESLSHALTLEPGDILATGTPEGVGFARTPPEFMQHGDIMETEIEGIGTMRNRLVAQP